MTMLKRTKAKPVAVDIDFDDLPPEAAARIGKVAEMTKLTAEQVFAVACALGAVDALDRVRRMR
jgi:hypothetical protein